MLQFIPSYLRDTTHFLNNLAKSPTTPPGSLLVTMDVTGLYSNIPHNEGIQACEIFLKENGFTETKAQDLASLIKFVLTHNVFVFNNKAFIQTQGTAMGTKMAPAYANIFMWHFETHLLSKFHLQPLIYYRYIDDLFFIWNHGSDSLDNFFAFANSLIKPQHQIHNGVLPLQVPFLCFNQPREQSYYHLCFSQTHRPPRVSPLQQFSPPTP